MTLDDLGEIWGYKLENAKEYGNLRLYTNVAVWLLVAIVGISAIQIMRSATVTFGSYLSTMFFMVIICFVVYGLNRRSSIYRVYTFYRHYKKCNVQHLILRLTESDFYDALYMTYRGRLSEHESVDAYIQVAYESCVRDSVYARRLLQNLMKVERTDGTGELFDIYFVEKRKSKGLVAIKQQKTNEIDDISQKENTSEKG